MLEFKRSAALIVSLYFVLACVLNAQATFQFTVQSWGTYTTYDHGNDSTTTQLGVGIRRARLRGKMTRGKATAFIQFDAATAAMTDAQIDYAFSDDLILRMGHLWAPAPRLVAGHRIPPVSISQRGQSWDACGLRLLAGPTTEPTVWRSWGKRKCLTMRSWPITGVAP